MSETCPWDDLKCAPRLKSEGGRRTSWSADLSVYSRSEKKVFPTPHTFAHGLITLNIGLKSPSAELDVPLLT